MLRLLVLILAALSALAQVPATDAQIEAQLHDRLVKSVIGKDGFVAKVKAGVVYWEGTTAVAQHKGAATRMAKSSGARRVVNNIKVKKAGGSPVSPNKAGETPGATNKAGGSPASTNKAGESPVSPNRAGDSPAPPKPKPTAEATPPATPAPPLKRVTVQWREARP